jgi:hypothetical protein
MAMKPMLTAAVGPARGAWTREVAKMTGTAQAESAGTVSQTAQPMAHASRWALGSYIHVAVCLNKGTRGTQYISRAPPF